jgi:predicted Rossmann fold flavoprotein
VTALLERRSKQKRPEKLLKTHNVIVIGAGAAGLMCAIEAGKRGRSVLVLEHNAKVGEKILISGGGRSNFTNLNAESANYLSGNPHFCKSALSRFSASDFTELVEKHKIAYHEKKLGQLFCDSSSQQIIDMLIRECNEANVELRVGCEVKEVERGAHYRMSTSLGSFESDSLVVATGGLSIPQLGATNFAFSLARQFGLNTTKLKPGLVPLSFNPEDLRLFGKLAGISIDSVVSCGAASFREHILFTHRGLSGPGILQASSYWDYGGSLTIDLLPDHNASDILLAQHQTSKELTSVLDQHLPRRFAVEWSERLGGARTMQRYSRKELEEIATGLHHWKITPSGTEGFGKAEVTVGGIDTDGLSSKTMEARSVPGLYFIGECVDVTGWLGGYNFQWAWSSGWVAGQYA